MMKNPFKVLIITCWILLVLCCIAKLFGANWFEPNVNNEKIKVMFGFLDEHIVWKYIVYCIYAAIAHSLVINAILGQKFYTLIQAIIFIPIIIGMSLLSWYNNILSSVLNTLCYLLTIIWLKKKWYIAIIGIALMLGFQTLSILIKNVGSWNLNNEPALVALLMQIDALIMIVLYYLYSNYIKFKKEGV